MNELKKKKRIIINFVDETLSLSYFSSSSSEINEIEETKRNQSYDDDGYLINQNDDGFGFFEFSFN